MNRRKFLQILGLAAAAPAAVFAARRAKPVEIVKTHEKVRTPIGGRIVRAEDPWTGLEICETTWQPLDFRCLSEQIVAQQRAQLDLAAHFPVDVDEAAALLRRAAGGA